MTDERAITYLQRHKKLQEPFIKVLRQ